MVLKKLNQVLLDTIRGTSSEVSRADQSGTEVRQADQSGTEVIQADQSGTEGVHTNSMTRNSTTQPVSKASKWRQAAKRSIDKVRQL